MHHCNYKCSASQQIYAGTSPCMPPEFWYLNCIFCYKLIQICVISISEVDIWPGGHICLHFATAKCWHFGNTVLNPTICSFPLALGWTKVKEKLWWYLRRPSKVSLEPDKSTFLSEGTVMNMQAGNRLFLMKKKNLSFNTLETIRGNTSFPNQLICPASQDFQFRLVTWMYTWLLVISDYVLTCITCLHFAAVHLLFICVAF